MNNNIFDYSWYYSKWHQDTEQSKRNDMDYAKWMYETHGIYPSPPSDFSDKDFGEKESKPQNSKIKESRDKESNKQESNGKESIKQCPNKARVLEIGCGMGRFLLHLQEKGYSELFGVDIDESQYSIAKKEGLDVFLSDVKTFLLKDPSKYHAIYAFDVLEHIDKAEQLCVLKLIFNHLHDSGMLVIQVPNSLAPSATYFRYNDFTHNVSYTEDSLGFLLHNAGFHNFCIRPTHNESKEVQNLKLLWARLYRLEFGIEPILTPNIIAIAFKNKKAYEFWQKQAPAINNLYEDSNEKPELKHKIKKLWKKLCKKPYKLK